MTLSGMLLNHLYATSMAQPVSASLPYVMQQYTCVVVDLYLIRVH